MLQIGSHSATLPVATGEIPGMDPLLHSDCISVNTAAGSVSSPTSHTTGLPDFCLYLAEYSLNSQDMCSCAHHLIKRCLIVTPSS